MGSSIFDLFKIQYLNSLLKVRLQNQTFSRGNKMSKGLNNLIGLFELKQLAQIDIESCKVTKKPFPHCIITGPGGLGKTALVNAIAEEMNYHLICVEAAAIKNRQKIIHRLQTAHDEANQAKKTLLFFVDEIHRLTVECQEVFYYPMDKEKPFLTTDAGTVYFKPFSFFAATTRPDVLDQRSFVGRFDNVWQVKPYKVFEIGRILDIWFFENKLQIAPNITHKIAERSLGTPRQAIRIAQKIRNYCIGKRKSNVSLEDCNFIFELEKIDSIGLTELHLNYLEHLSATGEPKGIDAIAGKIGQNKDVVLGVIEPVLLSLGFIDMTTRGRKITENGLNHLKNNQKT